MSNDKDDDSLLESKLYFKLGNAVDDVKYAYGAGETAAAGAKLVGKTLSNTVVFAGKFGWSVLQELGKKAQEAKK